MSGFHPPLSNHLAALQRAGSVFPDTELSALIAASVSPTHLSELVSRRVAGTPMQYLLGHVEFAGLRLLVREGTFIPRPRTEFLAKLAVARLRASECFLDLACGVGPVAAYVAHRRPDVTITAVDNEPTALAVAHENLRDRAALVRASGPPALEGSNFHVIAANLPYVPTSQLAFMPLDVREFEPLAAIDGGSDGLEPLRLWAVGLPRLLRPGGTFLVEVGRDQCDEAGRILGQAFGRPINIEVCYDRQLEGTVVALTV
ncbi:HemK/PrmC family methyltransferase [Nocardioides sp.]|uniref:HemK/PrmC family methyltransferase n=1 Tax=Nocardioides sp. TaxID=35761 RepID=UPI002735A69A|nr:HemK/PrmC family methyltransferase [Nocardioides sp.]MDP3889767.1 HemK/PrmC family methyltransferase [Nocardioides sp.]